MLILGIETSCDETSASIVEAKGGFSHPKFRIFSNVVSSQVKLHQKYGGVVPHLAAREHAKNLVPVVKEATKKIPRWYEKIECITVTKGPGLIPSLLVGVNFARALAYSLKKPILGVNHLEGHVYSNWLSETHPGAFASRSVMFPAVSLVVSGGHTELFFMRSCGKFKRLGQTRDDAAGESFDKVARILGIGYPGGPFIDKLSKKGDLKRFMFPRPMINAKNYDFSFSGLKTAVRYLLEEYSKTEIKRSAEDFAASFQEAVVETLVAKTIRAAREFGAKTIMVSGGVSANSRLREAFSEALRHGSPVPPANLLFPPRSLTTDNAAMIAMAGYFRWRSGKHDSWKTLTPDPNLKIR